MLNEMPAKSLRRYPHFYPDWKDSFGEGSLWHAALRHEAQVEKQGAARNRVR